MMLPNIFSSSLCKTQTSQLCLIIHHSTTGYVNFLPLPKHTMYPFPFIPLWITCHGLQIVSSLPTHMLKSSGPQSVTLCGSRVLGGSCPCAYFRILRGNHSGFRLRPKCNDWGPRQRHREEKLRKDRQRDLPAGPVAETLCFQRRGPGFGPWSGI